MKTQLKEVVLDSDSLSTHATKQTRDQSILKPIELKKKKSFPWKIVLIVLSPLLILTVLCVVLGILLLPLQGVPDKAKVVVEKGKIAAAAIKVQDLGGTKVGLADTRKALTDLQKEYEKVEGLSKVPILGNYILDGKHGINAAFAGLDAADKAIEALEPNADLLGFTGKSSFVSGSADERLQTAVKTMRTLTPKVNEMAQSIALLQKEIDYIDPERYPENIRGTEIRSKLKSVKQLIDDASNLFINAQPLLVKLPDLLGEPNDKRYLVLFQNNGEQRPTGGFISAYGQFRIAKGKVILEKADDIYNLDNAMTKKFPPPREITTFHKGVYNLFLRDSNLSPDFKLSMQKFEELYDTVAGKEKIDGIWALDTHVLVEALRILGPITISGREFSVENDKRCDCPKAIYELEDYSTRPVGYVREARKDIIGVLLQQLLQKALGVSPSQYWGRLFQMLLAEINQKHVLAYFHDKEIQSATEAFNMAGRIQTESETSAIFKYKESQGWDYLHINNSNMAGAKSNLFVSHGVTKDTTINSDGTATTKLVIDYKNPFPGSDCGLESGGLCLNAPLRNWIRIYVPKGSKLIDSKGSQSPKEGNPQPLEAMEDLNKTVFEGFLIVNPLGSAKLELSYTSPVKLVDGKYKLLIQKQPGTEGIEYTLKIGGKTKDKLKLLSDTEIAL